MGHQPQSFVSTFNTQGQVLNFYVQLWRYSQNQCICWKFWNTWINLCDQTACFSFNLNRLLSQVYTFNSTLETAKVWLKNGRKKPHDKISQHPEEQFVAFFLCYATFSFVATAAGFYNFATSLEKSYSSLVLLESGHGLLWLRDMNWTALFQIDFKPPSGHPHYYGQGGFFLCIMNDQLYWFPIQRVEFGGEKRHNRFW